MADDDWSHDQVEKYVFGQLNPAERRQFEACLAQSAELRTLVRELEEGLVALAASAPHQSAPRAAWQNIESAVARETRWSSWRSLAGWKWIANGWAVAGCLAALVVLQVVFPRPPAPATVSLTRETGTHFARPFPPVLGMAPVPAPVHSNNPDLAAQNTLAAIKQTSELRQRITRLEAQLAKMPQPPPVEPAGLKLVPPNADARFAHLKLSPLMQQALLLTVARQLGWSQKTASAPAANTSTQPAEPQVTFVDLAASTTDTAAQSPLTASLFAAQDGSGTAADSAANSNPDPGTGNNTDGSISMLQWDQNILAMIDPSTLSAGVSPLTVWAIDANGNPTVIGTVNLGSNPTVITISGANISAGQQYIITSGAATNIIAQYPPAQ
ncbi:MAG: hypothetical protein P4N60_12400 [Verrucomicrobiae bacterium]|nr:hypothetical protein [Verrucomicrobiae bacterium]